MSNRYETVFILTPVLSEAKAKETVKKYMSVLKTGGATIANDEFWGMRKLAYPIQKKSTGFYGLLEYSAEGELISKLETEFRRDECVIRFLTVCLDKEAALYADKRKKKLTGTETEKV